MCFDFTYNFFFLKHLSLEEEMCDKWSEAYTGLHVKYPLFLSDFTETSTFSTDFRNIFEYHMS